MKQKLIVACGSGVATSQTIASKISSMLENDGMDFKVEAVDYKSILNELPDAGIYVYIAQPDEEVLAKAKELAINVYPGIPFLTGMGMYEIYESIVADIKNNS